MFKFHFKRGLIFGVLGLLAGGIFWGVSPKIYQAEAELLLGSASVSNNTSILSPDVQRILAVGQANDARTEIQLLKSSATFGTALRNVAEDRNTPELEGEFLNLIRSYDVITPETRVNATQQDGSVVTIRVRAPHDPEIAADIAREVTEVYNEFRALNARNSLQNAIRYLGAQESASRKQLDEAEEKYKLFATERAIVNIDYATQSATQLVSNALTRVQDARAAYASAQAETASLERELSSAPRNTPSGTANAKPQTVVQLESQISQARQTLEQLRARYYEDHPRVQEVASTVRSMMVQLEKEKKQGLVETQTTMAQNPLRIALEQQYASAKSKADGWSEQLQAAERAFQEVQDRLKALPTDEAQIRQLARDVSVSDMNYRRVKQQLDELKNRQDTVAQTAPVLQEARAFINPVAPDREKALFIGLIAGLCIGLIYSFAVESMKLRVHTSQQLAELTGLPVVATIPALGRSKQKGLRHLALPGARPQESFRHMAYTFLARNHSFPRMLMFTGVGYVAGRTSAAIQFSMALASTGKKVLLVDCDPTRGLITKVFEAETKSGLSDIFSKTALPAAGSTEAFVSTEHQGLWLLPMGSDASQSLADRQGDQLEAIVTFLKGSADVIVFDVPPCDLFADASRLAGMVDEVCMVVSANTTNYAQIPNGYEILHRAGATEVSLILTDASPNDEPFANTKGYIAGN